MKLIVGLGNPGEKYSQTRHNIGFEVLDIFQDKLQSRFGNLEFDFNKKFNADICMVGDNILVKPCTFMNSSGESVHKIYTRYRQNRPELWVIHDDLDLALGSYKIQNGIGPKVHGGIFSIENKIGRKDFWRVRVGIDNRSTEGRIPGDAYVLMKFTAEEKGKISLVLDKVTKDLLERLF